MLNHAALPQPYPPGMAKLGLLPMVDGQNRLHHGQNGSTGDAPKAATPVQPTAFPFRDRLLTARYGDKVIKKQPFRWRPHCGRSKAASVCQKLPFVQRMNATRSGRKRTWRVGLPNCGELSLARALSMLDHVLHNELEARVMETASREVKAEPRSRLPLLLVVLERRAPAERLVRAG